MDGNVLVLTQYLESFTYIGLLLLLFMCGLGVPIPEDITLVLSGYLAYQGITHYPQTVIVGIVGVMVGDMTLYFIGNRWGTGIINHHRFNWIFTEKRMEKAQRYLRKYGKRTIFIARFLSGIRAGIHLTAGALRMNTFDFFIMDFLAALFSVPIFVYIGYYFGEHIEKALVLVSKSSRILLALVITTIAILFFCYLLKKRRETKL
ncbi:MAG: DedA family protein [Deltaproteobacteria bacterium]|nr:DedA family protein [Deltaproteobacteria bacterium]